MNEMVTIPRYECDLPRTAAEDLAALPACDSAKADLAAWE